MLRELIRTIYKYLKLIKQKTLWSKKNPHNRTTLVNFFPIEKVKVGNYSYGPLDISFFGNSEEYVEIGNFCSIADKVKILAGGEHSYLQISTYPLKRYVLERDEIEAKSKGPIIIKDDVWIGYGTIILSGVTIGQGSIIGAGSVVTKDIPPYSIYVGNSVVKKRFAENIVDKLCDFDYSNITKKDVEESLDLFYEHVDESFFESKLYLNNLINKTKMKEVGK